MKDGLAILTSSRVRDSSSKTFRLLSIIQVAAEAERDPRPVDGA